LKGKVQVTNETTETLLSINEESSNNEKLVKEALLALEALGYSKREISKVEKVLNKSTFDSVDEAVKLGLKTLVS
ncbi:RuvA C-terminal domain-containing protein, partial [Staphylococcus epidermidis]